MKHRTIAAALVAALLLVSAALTFADAPKAYVGLFKDNAVGVIDTATNSLIRTIPIPAGPHGVVVTPDGSTVFASSDGDSVVSVIDTATDSVTASIQVGKSPHGLAITPDGKTVLVAVFGTSSVAFIDVASRTVLGQAPAAQPHNIAVSPDGATAYVAEQKKGAFALDVLDIPTMSKKGTVPLDKMPRAIGVSPDGAKLYFTLAGADAVQVLDTATNRVVKQIPVGAAPHHPLFSPDGKFALVVSQGPGTLSRIDTASDSVQKIATVGKLPHWIALTGDGRAYVSNEESNDVSVVDLSTMKTTATVPVGNAPRKMVIQPAMGVSAGAMKAGAVTAGISGFAFPDSVTITAGQSVLWTNADAVPHTVSADNGSWDSGEIASGATFLKRFDAAGVFSYHCSIHPSMTGTIVVKARG
ncbi:MAG TPA: beta-propeller fold lactonase family protein [Spirochaetia bacterium]|nr:beta-propeller fold lactonase family protein [Spirochaetia bacterium]